MSNPLICVYAFVGCMDSTRFLRGQQVHGVVVTAALLCAVGQVGGPAVVRVEPGFFAALAVVNLAGAMLYLAGERTRPSREIHDTVAQGLVGVIRQLETDAVEALADLVARWARTHRVVATFDADDAPLDGRHGDVLLRVTQESLANVARLCRRAGGSLRVASAPGRDCTVTVSVPR